MPRYLNRLGSYVLANAALLNAKSITPEILHQGFEYTDAQLRCQDLTPEDYYVLELVLKKKMISDETVTIEDLEQLKTKEFNEVMPILERLVQLDLLYRLPTENEIGFVPSPLLLEKDKGSDE